LFPEQFYFLKQLTFGIPKLKKMKCLSVVLESKMLTGKYQMVNVSKIFYTLARCPLDFEALGFILPSL
jgi:hypothetical protein